MVQGVSVAGAFSVSASLTPDAPKGIDHRRFSLHWPHGREEEEKEEGGRENRRGGRERSARESPHASVGRSRVSAISSSPGIPFPSSFRDTIPR
jgi:hypothetical protein